MRFIARILLSVSIAATLAYTQTQMPPHFNHIVIVVQENRTPDNLFGSAPLSTKCSGQDDFEPGVDIQDWGNYQGNAQCFAAHTLGPDSCNPDHTHGGFKNMWDGGNLDSCGGGADCPVPNCYAFVQKSDVQQYFDIATSYGFANYMFQTSEGPSFPAHQFIFSGTSAPEKVNNSDPNKYWQWFAAENMPDNQENNAGCAAASGQTSKGINFLSPYNETADWYAPPPGTYPGFPCYDHPTLTDELDHYGPPAIQWRYYAAEGNSIWTAPNAISHICNASNGSCQSSQGDWKYVSLEYENPNGTYNLAPVLTDIQNCNLAQVSWVTPDVRWSDHPGSSDNIGLGPDYVSNIVDAIGQSGQNSKCDYWKADPTVILILWDDWGGWYDHVPTSVGVGYKGGNLSGIQYVFGFRVPLLVVSSYTPARTVSGAITGQPTYPPPAQFTHDFGSILAFIENNWSGLSEIYPSYHYADRYALDNNPPNYFSLGDFFTSPSQLSFTSIPTQHPPSFYTSYQEAPQGPVDGPDD